MLVRLRVHLRQESEYQLHVTDGKKRAVPQMCNLSQLRPLSVSRGARRNRFKEVNAIRYSMKLTMFMFMP